MNCLIIEDDLQSLGKCAGYVNQCPELKLEGACSSIDKATKILSQKTIDLLFLDVELGGGDSGLEFYKSLKVKPCIIVMTAHSQYAIDSHKIHASGFLHKPFNFDIFKETVDYAVNIIRKQKRLDALHQIEHDTGSYIPILDNKKEIELLYSDIAYFESKGNNVVVYTILNIEYNLGRRSISQLEKELPYRLFQRINKRQIINKSNIQKTFGDIVRINNKMLKISARALAEINKNTEQEII